MTETKALNCPKCKTPMRELKTDDARVDRCDQCFGIWLDEGERLKVVKNKGAVAGLDIGSAETGHKQDAITEVDCPRCEVRMHHIQDPAQKHIGYEFCRECQGSFFDAGELTDLSEFSLSERIKSFLGK